MQSSYLLPVKHIKYDYILSNLDSRKQLYVVAVDQSQVPIVNPNKFWLATLKTHHDTPLGKTTFRVYETVGPAVVLVPLYQGQNDLFNIPPQIKGVYPPNDNTLGMNIHKQILDIPSKIHIFT